MYEKVFKRVFDLVLSLTAFIILLPLILILTVVGAVTMKGNPFFLQPRPGKDERIFNLIKFRSMTNEKDMSGNLLSDDVRLVPWGKFLRHTSLDELPSLINIIAGDLAIVGPRPQLVRDMVFMTPEQRRRHSIRQGLTGLAQVNGRNSISWEKKLSYDIKYIEDGITLKNDLKIIFMTVLQVLKPDEVDAEGMATAEDFGDYLLRTGAVSKSEYDKKQSEAKELLGV